LGECLRLAPGDSQARFDLALAYFSQQKADPLVPLVERLLTLDPHNKQYASLQATAYSLLGYNDRAIQIFSALLQQHPEGERVWLVYGRALRLARNRDEAMAACRKSTQLRPQFGEAWFSLSNLKTLRFTPEDLETMRHEAARQDIDDDDRMQFEFALGKALE